MMQILQPPGWARAKGFSNGVAAKRSSKPIRSLRWTPRQSSKTR